jgi:hypothetical protein
MFAGGASRRSRVKPREAPAIHQNAFIRWPAEMVKVVEMVEKNSRAGQEGTAGLIELRATSTFVLISVTVSGSSSVWHIHLPTIVAHATLGLYHPFTQRRDGKGGRELSV